MGAVGIDIGGSCVKAAAMAGAGEGLVARSRKYARPDAATLRAAIGEAISGLDIGGKSPDAVGLCVPGIFDSEAGVVRQSMNMPALVGLPLRDEVRRVVGSHGPVRVVTDTYAAAFDYAFSRLSEQARAGRLLALSLGTGVGGCVLDDGRPLHVSGESPGHFGQLDVTLPEDAADPPIGPDGGAGSLEAYIGAPALRRRFGEGEWGKGWPPGPNDPALRALAKAIRITHAIYRPQHVVLLGGVGVRLRGSISALRGLVEDRLTSLARPGWTLDVGEDEFHAARGAARLAQDRGSRLPTLPREGTAERHGHPAA